MVVSTAVSVAAFSVVLAESFVAVATSTLVPATFLAAARAAKGAIGGGSPSSSAPLANMPGTKAIVDALKSAVGSIDEIDLLVPRTAKIHGEFEFEASEAYAANASLGGTVNVVSISAGYSALYQTSSRNKITLDVEFAAVNYRLSSPAPAPAP